MEQEWNVAAATTGEQQQLDPRQSRLNSDRRRLTSTPAKLGRRSPSSVALRRRVRRHEIAKLVEEVWRNLVGDLRPGLPESAGRRSRVAADSILPLFRPVFPLTRFNRTRKSCRSTGRRSGRTLAASLHQSLADHRRRTPRRATHPRSLGIRARGHPRRQFAPAPALPEAARRRRPPRWRLQQHLPP